MKTKHHLCINLEGFLRNYKGKKINIMQHDTGKPMTDREAREYISELQSLGHKLMPCGECEGFDPFGKGCPGHEIKES